ncbi:hypothetical protein BJD55_gp051 [Gordonia phage Yvonnetastic]|uniref:Uncharacterized protein n=1 Tax=Gordonia phage Yvonnetastic TaxID=1821566 RepID=A0A142K9D2_9CAUD|nr:hypothetical protein BJD55_gp051 [Gordonia phage Yvonnetastic]AMS02715.1 hypothetical protein SEA_YVONNETASTIC_171 [Gordonia phage Yvonnetastic]
MSTDALADNSTEELVVPEVSCEGYLPDGETPCPHVATHWAKGHKPCGDIAFLCAAHLELAKAYFAHYTSDPNWLCETCLVSYASMNPPLDYGKL